MPKIENKIRMNFANALRADDLPASIEGTINGRDIMLTGTVDDQSLKERASNLAKVVTGVRMVKNEITVRPMERSKLIVEEQSFEDFTPIAEENINAPSENMFEPDQADTVQTVAERRKTCEEEVQAYLKDNTIQFDSSAITIKDTSTGVLNTVISILGECPQSLIVVEGHSDKSGDSYDNLLLSAERAASVSQYIMDSNLNMRVRHVGYGDQRPINNENTPQARTQNRRIEIKLETLGNDRYVKPDDNADQEVETQMLNEIDNITSDDIAEPLDKDLQPLLMPSSSAQE